MPIIFGLFTKKYARYRRTAAIGGVFIATGSFVGSSFSRTAWQLVASQGIVAALGCALIYSCTTLSLGEWFSTKNPICNRTVAYGITLSVKNIVGTACPFMMQGLIDSYGFRTTLWAWGIILFGTGIISVAMIPTPLNAHSPASSSEPSVSLSYSFLRHPTFYVYGSATMIQSTGYGIPTTYLSTYSRNIALLSPTIAALLLALTSSPGIASSAFFSFLSDNKHFQVSTATVNVISAIPSALATLFFWGFAVERSLPLLCIFAVSFGFFANGYSGAWGGIINDLEREAIQRGETVDTGLLYGLLNGLRGVGLVVGGISSVLLLHTGEHVRIGTFAYGTSYGLLILFAGLCLGMGGWSMIWKLANRLYQKKH